MTRATARAVLAVLLALFIIGPLWTGVLLAAFLFWYVLRAAFGRQVPR